MAQTEEVIILEVKTLDSVKNLNDLKDNIKALKHNLGLLDIGTQEYADTLIALKTNQNLLKDSMYATSASFDEVKASATGASESYNSLVHKMAELKQAWRATNDEAERNRLGNQIGEVNQKLKDMDASVGNFQRNVGNYSSALEGLKDGFLATAGGAGAIINPVKNVTAGFTALSATQVVGILGLLANVIALVIKNLDTSEKSSNRLRMALAPLQAGATLVTKAFQFLGDKLADVAEWVTKVMDKFGLINKEMKEHQDITKEEIALVEERRRVEMANADAQLQIAQLKAKAAEKDKFTAAERLKFIEEAAAKEREIADRNVEIARREYDVLKRRADLAENSKEENDALADAYVRLQNSETDYFNKVRELSAQRVEAINQIKAETKANNDLLASKEALANAEGADGLFLADAMTSLKEGEEITNARIESEMSQIQAMNDWWVEDMAQTNEELDAIIEDSVASLLESAKTKREMTSKEIVENTMSVADATSALMLSLADMYESDEKNAEKNAKKIKGLRIASATMDMLTGITAALSGAFTTKSGPWDIALAVAQAASIAASGIANINKIKSTDINGSGASVSASAPAAVSAPNIETELPSVRNVTTASEEDRLNRMASSQKVYILQSDIEAANNQSRVQVAESSF